MLKCSFTAALLTCLLSSVSPALADPDAGAYLAGRQAGTDSDFANSAQYYTKSLLRDPANPALLENALTSFIALDQIDRAVPLAEAMVESGYESQMANLVFTLHAAKTGAWEDIFAALEQGRSIGPLVDSLTQAWAHVGMGDMRKALASFDHVIDADSMTVYGLTHKAYALASVGDFEGAQAIYAAAEADNTLRYNRRSAVAHTQILSQLSRNDDALAVMDRVFGAALDPSLTALKADLESGVAVPYDTVSDPVEGIGDLMHLLAGAVQNDAPDAYTLLYARAATYLDPNNTDALLLAAALLENLGQFDLANQSYASIQPNDPSFHVAELGRAEVLIAAGRNDAAIEVLEALARSHPEIAGVQAAKGDTLRQVGRYTDAKDAYTKALALYDDANPIKWFIYYARGIANHQLHDWAAAETDFRAALALHGDHPQVLNYLGYSLVERGEKLDEALAMIQTAAQARPDSGAIVDSLGWVLFQMEHYEDAVTHMERAASLLPTDSVINDHLGDVYWAVGRETEANFQWNRALSFNPQTAEADRIRDKLARGLDMVRVDEGLDPIRIARDN